MCLSAFTRALGRVCGAAIIGEMHASGDAKASPALTHLI